MFHTLHELTDARVVATDGKIGRVCNVFFDDQSWKVRYFVVDLRGWRARRYVVLPVSLVEAPDWEKKILRARASKEQVRQCPDLDSVRPVARQQEIALRKYYHWPRQWEQVVGEFSIPYYIISLLTSVSANLLEASDTALGLIGTEPHDGPRLFDSGCNGLRTPLGYNPAFS